MSAPARRSGSVASRLWETVGMLLVFAVREPAKHSGPKAPPLPPPVWRVLSPPMRRYLLVLGLFTLARISETFLMLRGYELGQSLPWLLVMWAALNLVKAVTAFVGGALADGGLIAAEPTTLCCL